MITSIDETGINFIKARESFSPKVYNDNGKPAIGYGHDLLPGESFPASINEQQAHNILLKDAAKVFPTVNRMAPQANQNQFNALVSFGFNLGTGSLQKMLSHGFKNVPTQILRWNKKGVKGVMVVDPGLVARRELELKMFNS